MTITQLIQSSPTKATELFARLAETTNGAVKTREKLFSDLKEELELLARLEEEHLFPVLRKHKETKDLVSEALDDNKQTRALLAELEQMPKDGEEFLVRLGELRRVFQQHVRDEKKELLPAVKRALSDEEAQAIVERIEAEKAEIEEARRAEAEERRAEMRREREEIERQQAEAEASERRTREAGAALARSVATGGETVRASAETVQQVVQSGVSMAAQMAERSMDQFTRAFGLSGRESREAAEQSSRNIQAVAECSTVLAQGAQDISREWLDWAQHRFQQQLEGFNALLRCRTPQDFVALQSDQVRQNLELLIESTRRIAERSMQLAEEAGERIAVQAEETAGRARRSADRARRAA